MDNIFNGLNQKQVFSSKYQSRNGDFITSMKRAAGFLGNHSYFAEAPSHEQVQEAGLYNSGMSNLFPESKNKGLQKILQSPEFDAVTKANIYNFLFFLSKLISAQDRGNELDYETFLDDYRRQKLEIHKTFGYDNSWFHKKIFPYFEDKQISGKVIAARFKAVLAEILNTEKNLTEPENLKEAISAFIIGLSNNGFKNFNQLYLGGLNLMDHTFKECSFYLSNFSRANLNNTIFTDCNLKGCWFNSANLENMQIIGELPTGAHFTSILQFSEITFNPIVPALEFQFEHNGNITKSTIYSIVNEAELNADEIKNFNELMLKHAEKSFIRGMITVNLECPIKQEIIPLEKACIIQYPPRNVNSQARAVQFFDAASLWTWLKEKPVCPLTNVPIDNKEIKILTFNDIMNIMEL